MPPKDIIDAYLESLSISDDQWDTMDEFEQYITMAGFRAMLCSRSYSRIYDEITSCSLVQV